MAQKKATTKKKAATSQKSQGESKEERNAKSIEQGQPSVNIGLIGHVDHGKTTLTERLSGRWTDTHSEELKRGITIRLGYADALFRKCTHCGNDVPYTISKECEHCNKKTEAVRKVSFIDAPGHESLMATMIGGAAIMDGALLIIAANEECPQPQTREHMMTLEIIGIKNLVIIQNKVDLATEEEVRKNHEQIKEFIKGTSYEEAPIIPTSAKMGINMDVLIQAIEEHIPTPERDDSQDPLMYVARSFDVNKPGTSPQEITGGILGGTVKQGKFKKNEQVEILPGRAVEDKNTKYWVPIKTKTTGFISGGRTLSRIMPGGSVAMRTSLDPAVTKSDTLSGAVVGKPGKLPPLWENLKMKLHLLERVVGAKESTVVEPIRQKEVLMLNVNSAATVGVVTDIKKDSISVKLKLPVCAETGSRVTISRRVGNRFRLIGYGIISE